MGRSSTTRASFTGKGCFNKLKVSIRWNVLITVKVETKEDKSLRVRKKIVFACACAHVKPQRNISLLGSLHLLCNPKAYHIMLNGRRNYLSSGYIQIYKVTLNMGLMFLIWLRFTFSMSSAIWLELKSSRFSRRGTNNNRLPQFSVFLLCWQIFLFWLWEVCPVGHQSQKVRVQRHRWKNSGRVTGDQYICCVLVSYGPHCFNISLTYCCCLEGFIQKKKIYGFYGAGHQVDKEGILSPSTWCIRLTTNLSGTKVTERLPAVTASGTTTECSSLGCWN